LKDQIDHLYLPVMVPTKISISNYVDSDMSFVVDPAGILLLFFCAVISTLNVVWGVSNMSIIMG